MDRHSDRKQVSQYLNLIRNCISNELRISHRKTGPDKNYDFLRKHGLSLDDVRRVIEDLEVRDYSAGPCDDDKDLPDRNDVWKFGKTMIVDSQSYEVYIKLSVGQKQDEFICICISFHPCEHPISYPFR